MGKIFLMVLSVPAPWLVFILIGEPCSGLFVVAGVLFMGLLGTMLRLPLGVIALLVCIAWAMMSVQQQNPASFTRRGRDEYR